MKNIKGISLLLTTLSFTFLGLSEEASAPAYPAATPAPTAKPFVKDQYTHAADEVHPDDWKGSDVTWCTGVKMKANCLVLIPSKATVSEVDGKSVIKIPLRSHLYFNNGMDGTIWYYGDLSYVIETKEISVKLDPSRTVFSKTGEETFNARWAGIAKPETYREKMEKLLKDYFDKSEFLQKTIGGLLKKLPSLPKIIPAN